MPLGPDGELGHRKVAHGSVLLSMRIRARRPEVSSADRLCALLMRRRHEGHDDDSPGESMVTLRKCTNVERSRQARRRRAGGAPVMNLPLGRLPIEPATAEAI